MTRTISFRRHHEARIKSRERKKHKQLPSIWAITTPKSIGKAAATPCMCSCYMCGNYRKHYGLTISEISHSFIHSEMLKEL